MTKTTNSPGHALPGPHQPSGPGLEDSPDWSYRDPGSYAAWALWRAADLARNTVGLLGVLSAGILAEVSFANSWPVPWLAPVVGLVGGAVLAFTIDARIHRMRAVIVDGNNRRSADALATTEATSVSASSDTDDDNDEPYTWNQLLTDMDECTAEFTEDLAALDQLDWPEGQAATYSHGQAAQRLLTQLAEQRRVIATACTMTAPQHGKGLR